MAKFDEEINHLDQVYEFSCAAHQVVSESSDEKKLLVCERGPLLFVFNFHPSEDYVDVKVCLDMSQVQVLVIALEQFSYLQVGVGEGGKYKIILDSDAFHVGGPGRIPHDPELFSTPEGVPGQPETNFNDRPHSVVVPSSPSRSVVVYANMDKTDLWARATKQTEVNGARSPW